MEETRRQASLEALGLTPWVARSALPGAAASPCLERPVPAAPEETRRNPEPPAAPEPAPDTDGAGQPVARSESRSEPTGAGEGAARFTLHAFATPSVLLMVQQADPDAPEPGRQEQQLLASLLRYFHATGARPRTFAWPLPGAADEAEQARASLEAFAGRLGNDHGLPRVLWLLEEPRVRLLLGRPRHEPFEWQGLGNLAVATLAEMLADPARDKAVSWQSMVRHGFTA
jgi:hypothetical protein